MQSINLGGSCPTEKHMHFRNMLAPQFYNSIQEITQKRCTGTAGAAAAGGGGTAGAAAARAAATAPAAAASAAAAGGGGGGTAGAAAAATGGAAAAGATRPTKAVRGIWPAILEEQNSNPLVLCSSCCASSPSSGLKPSLFASDRYHSIGTEVGSLAKGRQAGSCDVAGIHCQLGKG